MTDTVCIFHQRCFDGITAAWVVDRRYYGAKLIAAKYQTPPPPMEELAGKRVFIVDFSYPREILKEIKVHADTLSVFDHHDTARKNCEGLEYTIFDNERCGAAIVWDFLNPGQKRPALIDYAQDYDLWKFELPYSHEVNATLQSHPLTTNTIETLSLELEESIMVETLEASRFVVEGRGILRAHQRVVETIARNAIELEICGNNVLGVECPREFGNEVASLLAQRRLFGVTFSTKKDGFRHYHLRTRESGFRVCDLAEKFGGGGHADSAGFRLKLAHGGDPFQVRDKKMLGALNTGFVPPRKG